VTERQLDSFLDFLFLNIETTNVSVRHIRFLSHLHHLDSGISVWRQNINDSLRALVDSHTGVGGQIFSVEGGEDSDIGLRSAGAADDTVVFINHLNEVSSADVDSLNALNLFFGSDVLRLEMTLLVLNVVFLNG
jgi:hypothetical protein